jgi:hypothetical protein
VRAPSVGRWRRLLRHVEPGPNVAARDPNHVGFVEGARLAKDVRAEREPRAREGQRPTHDQRSEGEANGAVCPGCAHLTGGHAMEVREGDPATRGTLFDS